MRAGSPEQVRQVPEIEAHGMEWADVYLELAAHITCMNLQIYRLISWQTIAALWELSPVFVGKELAG